MLMEIYCNNWNQVLKEQLAGISVKRNHTAAKTNLDYLIDPSF